MDKFLDTYNQPRLNRDEVENPIIRPPASRETESGTGSLLTNRSLGPGSVTGEFYLVLKEGSTPLLLNPFQKIEEGGALPNTLCEASVTLTPKPDRDATERKLQANIHGEHGCENPQQNLSKLNSTIH